MVNLGTAMAYLDLDTSGFNNGISSALNQLNVFNDKSATSADKLTAVGSSFSSVGKTLTTSITLPIVGIGTAAVKTASEFEAVMSKVSAISGATGDDFEALSKKAQEMGAKTKFSATEAGEAFTYMAMAGWKTEDMLNGVEGIMSLAAADGLDLATTSDIVTDALTAFGLQASDSSHFADVLATAASNANTNVSMMGESFKYVGALAGTMGYSIEDISLGLGLMANSGIKASQAGTALRGAITRLASPTKQAATYMEKLGYYTEGYNDLMFDSEGNAKSFKEVMGSLRESFAGLSEEEQSAAAKAMFGQQALAGMLSIINASEEDYNALAGAIDNADGKAEEMSKTMLNNLNGAVTILKSNLETLMIFIGKQIVPFATKAVKKITSIVEAINTMDEAEKQQILRIIGITAAIGPALMLIGSVITKIGSLLGAMKTISTMLSTGAGTLAGITAPVLAVVAAIAAVTAALVYLYNTNEDFRDGLNSTISRIEEFIKQLGNQLKPHIDNLVEAIKKLWEKAQPLIELFGELFLTVLNEALSLIEKLAPALSPLMDLVTEIIDTATNILSVITAVLTGDKAAFDEAIQALADNVSNIFDNAFSVIEELFSGVLDFIKENWDSYFGEGSFDKVFGETVENLKGFIEDLKETFNKAIDIMKEHLEPLQEAFSNAFQGALDWWNENGEDLKTKVEEVLSDINNLLQPIITLFKEDFKLACEEFMLNIEDALYLIEGIVALLNGDFDTYAEKMEEFGANLYDLTEINKERIENLSTAWSDFWEEVGYQMYDFGKKWNNFWEEYGAKEFEKNKERREKWMTFWEDVGEYAFDAVQQWKEDITNFFTKTIPEMFERAKQKISNLWSQIGQTVSGWFGGDSGIDGSHANGLAYVPYDGYIAELHKGERVLTAEENTNYSQGSGAPVFNQYIMANTDVDRFTLQKDTEDLLTWGGVRV